MPRIAYVNGRYLPHHAATVHIEDRGYQFADGVYEVIAVHHGRLVDGAAHLDRLDYSMGELDIAPPMSRRALLVVMNEVIRRNRLQTGALYLQVTRGVASRDHVFPEDLENSSLIVNTRPIRIPPSSKVDAVRVITTPDIRWKRPDIKSIALLPNVLVRVEARKKGAFEAWMVDEGGYVTEGGASNAWIVDADGKVITRPLSQAILSGITRKTLIRLANECQIPVIERPFTVAEAKEAKEAFLTSATSFVKPVGRIDETTIGDGKPGPVTTRLLEEYLSFMNALCA